MANLHPKLRLDQPALYQIKVQGRLDQKWEPYFNNMQIHVETGRGGPPITTLTGRVLDQSSLYGLINSIRDLGLPLLLVEFVAP